MKDLATFYLAGYIEAKPDEAFAWREKAYKELYVPGKSLVYDPIQQEASKTGKKAGDHVLYVQGLKKAGKYKIFDDEMDKIWLGGIKRTTDLARLFKLLKDRAFIDGNTEEELKHFGDYEAVARADAVLAYMKTDIQTVGTIGEIFEAMLLNIPVYLVIDSPKTNTNSTLLYWVRYTNGEIFYTLDDALKFMKYKYNLKVKGE